MYFFVIIQSYFDEAQDADPVMLSIVEAQSHAQRIYCGDQYQLCVRGQQACLDLLLGVLLWWQLPARSEWVLMGIASGLCLNSTRTNPLHQASAGACTHISIASGIE
jgi:hypothetical protein